MTENQLKYLSLQETARHNLAMEDETNRANLAKETETNRANLRNEELTEFKYESEDDRGKAANTIKTVEATAKMVSALQPWKFGA